MISKFLFVIALSDICGDATEDLNTLFKLLKNVDEDDRFIKKLDSGLTKRAPGVRGPSLQLIDIFEEKYGQAMAFLNRKQSLPRSIKKGNIRYKKVVAQTRIAVLITGYEELQKYIEDILDSKEPVKEIQYQQILASLTCYMDFEMKCLLREGKTTSILRTAVPLN